MRLLIDTATKDLLVALYRDHTLVDVITKEGHNDHSKTLMVEVEKMFERQGITPKELTSILVGEGPGTYTGVRIGVTVAKTMAYLLHIPLYTVSTLELVASTVEGNPVAVLLDAKRHHVFGCVYDKTTKSYVVQPKFRHIDEMNALLHNEVVVSTMTDQIKLEDVDIHLVDDIHTLTPNYLREWGE